MSSSAGTTGGAEPNLFFGEDDDTLYPPPAIETNVGDTVTRQSESNAYHMTSPFLHSDVSSAMPAVQEPVDTIPPNVESQSYMSEVSSPEPAPYGTEWFRIRSQSPNSQVHRSPDSRYDSRSPHRFALGTYSGMSLPGQSPHPSDSLSDGERRNVYASDHGTDEVRSPSENPSPNMEPMADRIQARRYSLQGSQPNSPWPKATPPTLPNTAMPAGSSSRDWEIFRAQADRSQAELTSGDTNTFVQGGNGSGEPANVDHDLNGFTVTVTRSVEQQASVTVEGSVPANVLPVTNVGTQRDAQPTGGINTALGQSFQSSSVADPPNVENSVAKHLKRDHSMHVDENNDVETQQSVPVTSPPSVFNTQNVVSQNIHVSSTEVNPPSSDMQQLAAMMMQMQQYPISNIFHRLALIPLCPQMLQVA